MLLRSGWRGACWRPCHRIFPLLLVLLAAAGCASYQPKPLAPDEFIEQVAQRTPSSAESSNSSQQAVVESDGLSLDEAKVVALFYNPTARAARVRAQVPVLSATKAGLWDDPEVGVDAMRILRPIDKPWIIGSSLALTIPLSGRLGIEKAKANAEGRAALVEAWTVEQAILLQLENEWIEAAAARRAWEAGKESQRQLDEVVEITNRLEAEGELIAAEAVAFRLAQSRARLDADSYAARAAQSETRLLALLGLTAGVPVKLLGDPASDSPATPPDREDVVSRNPLVALRAAEYELAEESLRLEVRRQYPDLALGPAYGNEDGQSRVGLGFSFPLPILNANKRGIVEAEARRESARAAWEESVQSAMAELAALNAKLDAIDRRREQLRAGISALSESQLAEARRLADQGEVNALLLLEALQSRREIVLEQIEADAERSRILAALRALAPEPTPLLPTPAKGGTR